MYSFNLFFHLTTGLTFHLGSSVSLTYIFFTNSSLFIFALHITKPPQHISFLSLHYITLHSICTRFHATSFICVFIALTQEKKKWTIPSFVFLMLLSLEDFIYKGNHKYAICKYVHYFEQGSSKKERKKTDMLLMYIGIFCIFRFMRLVLRVEWCHPLWCRRCRQFSLKELSLRRSKLDFR